MEDTGKLMLLNIFALRKMCSERGLSPDGKKPQLIRSLQAHDAEQRADGPNLMCLSVEKLTQMCRDRGLSVLGGKASLAMRLTMHSAHLRHINSISTAQDSTAVPPVKTEEPAPSGPEAASSSAAVVVSSSSSSSTSSARIVTSAASPVKSEPVPKPSSGQITPSPPRIVIPERCRGSSGASISSSSSFSSAPPSLKRTATVGGETNDRSDVKRQAVVSSSSSDRVPPTKEIYYYWEADCCSYTLREFESVAKAMFDKATVVDDEKDGKTVKALCVTSPHGADFHCDTSATAKDFVNSWRRGCVPRNIDVSRTNGDKECIFTLEKYENPVRLNLNGRTYSKKALFVALEKTLYVGLPLRLEDITIYPDQIHDVHITNNFTLGNWAHTSYNCHHRPIVRAPFSQQAVEKRNCPPVSHTLDSMRIMSTEVYNRKIEALFAEYLRHRSEQSRIHSPTSPLIFRDIRIENIPVICLNTVRRIKFVNVEFRACILNCDLYKDLDFASCRFVQCVILQSSAAVISSWAACQFDECRLSAKNSVDVQGLVEFARTAHVNDCICDSVYPKAVTEWNMRTMTIDTLRRRLDIASGKVPPGEKDDLTHMVLSGDKWMCA